MRAIMHASPFPSKIQHVVKIGNRKCRSIKSCEMAPDSSLSFFFFFFFGNKNKIVDFCQELGGAKQGLRPLFAARGGTACKHCSILSTLLSGYWRQT